MRRSSRDTDNLKQQNLEEFGMKIKKYRKTAGMTAEDLAKELAEKPNQVLFVPEPYSY